MIGMWQFPQIVVFCGIITFNYDDLGI